MAYFVRAEAFSFMLFMLLNVSLYSFSLYHKRVDISRFGQKCKKRLNATQKDGILFLTKNDENAMNECQCMGESILPHREPFLFLDKILSHDAKRSVGVVTFGPERDFFRGHFPGYPVVPGVILLEAMCQSAAAGVLIGQHEGQYAKTSEILLFAGADNVRFRRPVRPGETLTTHADVIRVGRGIGRFHVKGFVDGVLAAEADIFCVARKGDKT